MEAAHFKRIRCLLGFSQRQLARALGVGKGSVSRWEAGALPVPRQTALALMALRSPELDNALAEVLVERVAARLSATASQNEIDRVTQAVLENFARGLEREGAAA